LSAVRISGIRTLTEQLEGVMTCLAADPGLTLSASGSASGSAPGKWELIRASVFWGFILLVIVSPAVLGSLILLRA
jgi:hypothetical protein